MSYGLHGLRLITNATYEPSGRDWFFTGDYFYRNGRRTPGPQDRWKAYTDKDIPRQPLGRPKEMRRSMSSGKSLLHLRGSHACEAPTACPASRHVDRWRCFQEGSRRSAEAPSGHEPEMPRSKNAASCRTSRDDRAAKYSCFSERVPIEDYVPTSSPPKFPRSTYQDSLPKDFEAAKLGAKYPFFSERVLDEDERRHSAKEPKPWRSTYQDFQLGFDASVLLGRRE